MLTKLMIEARADELRRAAARAGARREAGATRARDAEAADVAITIRPALPDDAAALARLADLDCAPVPAGAVLLAEANGELRAALSLCDGTSVANPFRPTEATVQLLVARAAQLCGEPRRTGTLWRLVRALSPRRHWRTSLTRSI
jgi:hypothetical protein